MTNEKKKITKNTSELLFEATQELKHFKLLNERLIQEIQDLYLRIKMVESQNNVLVHALEPMLEIHESIDDYVIQTTQTYIYNNPSNIANILTPQIELNLNRNI
jgi:hypothetical protein